MSTPEFPLGYLYDSERGARVWVDHLAYDELAPFKEDGTRPHCQTKQLVYASVTSRDIDIKRLCKSIKDGNDLSFRMNRQYHYLTTGKTTPFSHWTQPLAGTYHHGLIVHSGATSVGAGRFPVCYLVLPPEQLRLPDTAPQGFFEFFNRITPMPLKPSWEQTLWTMAIKQGWVLLCPGYRSHVLRIEPSAPLFATELQQAIAQKRFK